MRSLFPGRCAPFPVARTLPAVKGTARPDTKNTAAGNCGSQDASGLGPGLAAGDGPNKKTAAGNCGSQDASGLGPGLAAGDAGFSDAARPDGAPCPHLRQTSSNSEMYFRKHSSRLKCATA